DGDGLPFPFSMKTGFHKTLCDRDTTALLQLCRRFRLRPLPWLQTNCPVPKKTAICPSGVIA
ncbi:hypothetical protein, partial [Bacillus sp. S20C3]|uniref:hypothetical protein n=1 Tax=Bacillus sp. S20C3 TaxID=2918910 RepID=UPI0022826227|nr:hypothetical protein [Bacillus sp. S20C3]